MTEPGDRTEGTISSVDRELRDWLRSLAVTGGGAAERDRDAVLSEAGSDYVERIATDGTLAAALNELAAAEPDLAG